MKKVIYSIVAALILSVIFALLVPRLLLKGDARWTYQNDAARVDVKFSGHLKKGCVDAWGTDLQILKPEWLSDENYQGTVVLVPVSYQNKRCQIKLTPRAEEWGENATLVIEFKGRDFQHRGKRRAAWVSFRNITLNGQPVAAEKDVWHSKPFVLKYPLSSSEITLAFDICKPFAAPDISYVNFLLVFLAFLMIGLFSAPLSKAAGRVWTFINRGDIVEVLKDVYLHIDPVYRRSFWIIFGALCFAFGFHTVCFMWGNLDWPLLDHTHSWLTHAWQGRYMAYSVKALLSNGVYLPVIYDTIIFATLSLNAVLLCRYWRLEKRVIYYVLCGLVLTAQPFTLSMMYFVNMTPETFIGVTCILTALLLSEKIALVGESLTKKIFYSLIAIILVNFALAMYPVLINTIAVTFVGRLLVQSFDWDGCSQQQLKSYIRPYMVSASNIILGVVSYKFANIAFVFPSIKFYNTEMLPLAQVPERLGILFKQCFRQLYEYNLPFSSHWILWVFLGFTVILTLDIFRTGNLKQKVVRLFLLFGSLFATQTAMIIALAHRIDGRIELFGLIFFEVLVMVLFITKFRKLHNFSVIVGACVIFASIINDLDCLRVWKHGFDAEKMMWNRVLARMEIQKDFDPARKYDVVLIGTPISMRPRYYTRQEGEGMHCGGGSLLYEPYDFSFIPFRALQFYYPTRFRNKSFQSLNAFKADRVRFEACLRRLYQVGVLQKAEVWPKTNGLIVWKNVILLVTDGKELNNYRRKFERELRKK